MTREKIFEILATKLQEGSDDDVSMDAVSKYYINEGKGSPSDANFTDLNSDAIYDFTNTMGDINPFKDFL